MQFSTMLKKVSTTVKIKNSNVFAENYTRTLEIQKIWLFTEEKIIQIY